MKTNTPFLFVAVDDMSYFFKATVWKAKDVSGVEGDFGYKINLDAALDHGLESAVSIVRGFDPHRQLFVDLKMWNGKRTMASVVKQAVDLGVDYINVYALADDQIPEAVEMTKGSETKVLAVTVLTHYTEEYCKKHFRRTHEETVRHLTQTAIDAGCHGVILPGTALKAVRHFLTTKVCPGIRPAGYKDNRHAEEVTPGEAKEWGADIVVCGSPIMKAEDPAMALRQVLGELS